MKEKYLLILIFPVLFFGLFSLLQKPGSEKALRDEAGKPVQNLAAAVAAFPSPDSAKMLRLESKPGSNVLAPALNVFKNASTSDFLRKAFEQNSTTTHLVFITASTSPFDLKIHTPVMPGYGGGGGVSGSRISPQISQETPFSTPEISPMVSVPVSIPVPNPSPSVSPTPSPETPANPATTTFPVTPIVPTFIVLNSYSNDTTCTQ